MSDNTPASDAFEWLKRKNPAAYQSAVESVAAMSANAARRAAGLPMPPTPEPRMLSGMTEVELVLLIDRILMQQERRSPQWVLHSRALQHLFVRLARALEGDDTTLRAEVEAVTNELGALIPWSDM